MAYKTKAGLLKEPIICVWVFCYSLDQELQRPGVNGWHDRTALVAIWQYDNKEIALMTGAKCREIGTHIKNIVLDTISTYAVGEHVSLGSHVCAHRTSFWRLIQIHLIQSHSCLYYEDIDLSSTMISRMRELGLIPNANSRVFREETRAYWCRVLIR